jgi:hypothetical protein
MWPYSEAMTKEDIAGRIEQQELSTEKVDGKNPQNDEIKEGQTQPPVQSVVAAFSQETQKPVQIIIRDDPSENVDQVDAASQIVEEIEEEKKVPVASQTQKSAKDPEAGQIASAVWTKYFLGANNANRNYPLAPGAGGMHYKELFENSIFPLLNDFRPDVIFLGAGFDSMRDDGMGEMNLTKSFYAWLVSKLVVYGPHFRQARKLAADLEPSAPDDKDSQKMPPVAKKQHTETIHTGKHLSLPMSLDPLSQQKKAQTTAPACSQSGVVFTASRSHTDVLESAQKSLKQGWQWGHLVVMTEGGYKHKNVMAGSKAIINALQKAGETLKEFAEVAEEVSKGEGSQDHQEVVPRQNEGSQGQKTNRRGNEVIPTEQPIRTWPGVVDEYAKAKVSDFLKTNASQNLQQFPTSLEQISSQNSQMGRSGRALLRSKLAAFDEYIMGLDLQMSHYKFTNLEWDQKRHGSIFHSVDGLTKFHDKFQFSDDWTETA